MKKTLLLLTVLLIASFCIAGCMPLKKIVTTECVPYSFAENESRTAAITFPVNGRNIRLVNCDGKKLPPPKLFTRWDPVVFPASKKLNLKLRADNETLHFYCPPNLEAGKEYKLTLRSGFLTLGRKLVLTDTETGKAVYEQKF